MFLQEAFFCIPIQKFDSQTTTKNICWHALHENKHCGRSMCPTFTAAKQTDKS